MFLFQGLSMGMLPPPAQLKVDKFPHHEGLSEADGGQDSYPKRERGKQSVTQIVHPQILVVKAVQYGVIRIKFKHSLTKPQRKNSLPLLRVCLGTSCIVVVSHSNVLKLVHNSSTVEPFLYDC